MKTLFLSVALLLGTIAFAGNATSKKTMNDKYYWVDTLSCCGTVVAVLCEDGDTAGDAQAMADMWCED